MSSTLEPLLDAVQQMLDQITKKAPAVRRARTPEEKKKERETVDQLLDLVTKEAHKAIDAEAFTEADRKAFEAFAAFCKDRKIVCDDA